MAYHILVATETPSEPAPPANTEVKAPLNTDKDAASKEIQAIDDEKVTEPLDISKDAVTKPDATADVIETSKDVTTEPEVITDTKETSKDEVAKPEVV